MTDPALPPEMEAEPVAKIRALLGSIEAEEHVVIPMAVESGSRAWGFPSPDSDYDCRFVYARPSNETFTLFPRRDVIERPISGLIDAGGWELSKALKLLLRGNAVIIEWLTSPFAYRADEVFRGAFLTLAHRSADRNLIGRHYFHLAKAQVDRFLSDPEKVQLKKLFYALRPLMALRWLERNPESAVAPMNFGELCAGAGLENTLSLAISDLVAEKARTREIGTGPIPTPILAFLQAEPIRLEHWHEPMPSRDPEPGQELADEFWREWTTRLAVGERKNY